MFSKSTKQLLVVFFIGTAHAGKNGLRGAARAQGKLAMDQLINSGPQKQNPICVAKKPVFASFCTGCEVDPMNASTCKRQQIPPKDSNPFGHCALNCEPVNNVDVVTQNCPIKATSTAKQIIRPCFEHREGGPALLEDLKRGHQGVSDDDSDGGLGTDSESNSDEDKGVQTDKDDKCTSLQGHQLGSGNLGVVYGLINADRSMERVQSGTKVYDQVLKVQSVTKEKTGQAQTPEAVQKEVEKQKMAASLGIAPKIQDFWMCVDEDYTKTANAFGSAIIVMDVAKGVTLDKYINKTPVSSDGYKCESKHEAGMHYNGYMSKTVYNDLKEKLTKLKEHNLQQFDFHPQNVMIDDNHQSSPVTFIDFGMLYDDAVKAPSVDEVLKELNCEPTA